MNVHSVRTEFVEFEDYKPEARFSSLHPLELIGSGTGNVECLASYVWRVADSSSLTPNLVCRKVIAPLDNQLNPQSGTLRFCGSTFPTINGTASYAVRFESAMSRATGIDSLAEATWMRLANCIDARAHSLLNKNFRWCDECIRSDQDLGIPNYVRLKWVTQAVRVCEIHQCWLQEKCANCGSRQSIPQGRRSMFLCRTCEAPLVTDQSAPVDMRESPHMSGDLWITSSIDELIACTALRSNWPDSDSLVHNLRQVKDQCFGGSRRRTAEHLALSKERISNLMRTRNQPWFSTVLDISYRLKIPVNDLVGRSDNIAFKDLMGSVTAQQKKIERSRLTDTQITAARRQLQKIVREHRDPAPLLKDVAKEVGISVSVLTKRFPMEADSIRADSCRYRDEVRRAEEQDLNRRLIASCHELVKAGKSLTERNVRKLSYLRPGELRDARARSQLDKIRLMLMESSKAAN